MPVYKDKERNTYYVVINHRVNGKNKPTFKRGFQTKREAVQYEKDAILEGKYAHTSGTFLDMAYEQCAYEELTEKTKREKIRNIKRYFLLCSKPIEKITKQDLAKWKNSFKEEKLATSSKNHIIGLVKSVFNYAEKIYELPNPTKALTPYKQTSDDVNEMHIWIPEQFEQLAKCLPNHVYQAYFTLLFWTGMRKSEALALCKDDIDFENNTISINKNITPKPPRVFTPLKTKASRRTISVDSVTMELLKPLCETADPYIFVNDSPLPVTTLDSVWRKAVKAAGLPYIRIHDLRHSHASWLIGNGVNIVAVSKRLGHSNLNQTLTVYTHLLESNSAEMINKIEKYRQKSIANV